MDESEVRHLEKQQVGKLKLSEAIRIGCRMSAPWKGQAFYGEYSCAIGAAYIGTFGRPAKRIGMYQAADELEDIGVWPQGLSPCELWMKNDSGWTRERIADWLESRGL